MTERQLHEWVQKGESDTLEFKATTGQRSDAFKTVCAFLNHKGGRVLIGVQPNHEIRGQQVSDGTLQDLHNELQFLEPPAFPDIEKVSLASGLDVIVLTVPHGSQRPYAYRGQKFLRVGTSNIKLPEIEANRILLERLHATSRWENEIADGYTVKDLDATEITRTLEEGIRRGRVADPGTRDPLELLRGFGLLAPDGRLVRAAVVLFAQAEALLPYYTQCLLRLARFRGVDKTEFLDNKQIHGNAFVLLRRAEQFLIENLPVAGRVEPGIFERIDDPLYPPVALREALANAICHRDYSIGGGSVGVAVYDDRLEITSSGILHFGLTPEALFEQHESLPWNPLIAKVFHRRGIIEAWGRGTLKMVELTKAAGLPKPDITLVAGAVTVRFLPLGYTPPTRAHHDLSDVQRRILLLLNRQALSLSEIHSRLGGDSVTLLRSLKDDLAMLQRLGLIGFSGRGRGARWVLK
jgi:ATP-dependent DNA helicase RecG